MDEATPAGAMGRVTTPACALALCWTVSVMFALLDAGLEMDEMTLAATF